MSDETPQEKPEAGPPPLLERMKRSPVTFALAAINVLVFVMVERAGSSTDAGTLLRFGAVERTHVLAGEVWRVLTPMFLHIGIIHLAWNTYASFGFCTVVESVLGRWRFLAVYLLSGFGGAAASALVWSRVGAGASGAMFGILGATLALRYRILGSAAALPRDPYVRSLVGQIVLWTVLGVVVLHFDHAAHFGGMAFGIAAGLAATSRRGALPWAVIGAMLLALVAAAARPGAVPDESTANDAMGFSKLWLEASREGFVRDVPRATRLAELACRSDEAPACLEIGRTMMVDPEAAVSSRGRAFVTRACDAKVAAACRLLE